MPGDAIGFDLDAARIFLQPDIIPGLQFLDAAAQHRFRPVRHGIGYHAALKVQDHGTGMHRLQFALVDPLLPVAYGKVRVGRKGKQRRILVAQIVLHILHPRLFRGPEEGAHGIAQRDVPFLQILQCIQAQHTGSLVIQNTAAQDIIVLLHQSERIRFPSFACGHHIQVSDRSQMLFSALAAELGPADPVIADTGLHAHVFRHAKHDVQHTPALRSVGSTFLRFSPYAGDSDDLSDIPDDVIPVFFYKRFYIVTLVRVHFFPPSSIIGFVNCNIVWNTGKCNIFLFGLL